MIKMFFGLVFSLTFASYTVYRRNKYWQITAVLFMLGAVIFLGQFVSMLGD